MRKSKSKFVLMSSKRSSTRCGTWFFFTTVCIVHLFVSFLILSEMAGFSQNIFTKENELEKSKYLYMRSKKIHKSPSFNHHNPNDNQADKMEKEKEKEKKSETVDGTRTQIEEYLSTSLKIGIKNSVQNAKRKKLFSSLKKEEQQRENILETSVKFNFSLTSNWKTIRLGREFELHVYSAYYDVQHKQVLTIGGSEKKNREKLRIKCCFHPQLDEKDEPPAVDDCPFQVEGKIQEMEEQKIFTHSTFFIVCPFDDGKNASKLPKFVSLDLDLLDFQNETLRKPSSSFSRQNIQIRLRIQYPWEQRFGRQVPLSICLKPLHSNLNQPLRFLEWLEFYRLMGVEKFTLYAQNPNPDLLCILKFYEDFGIVELLPWDIPFPVIASEDAWNRDRFNYGQSGAQNDCLYRHRGSSKFVAFIDMDEFIVPQNPWENLAQLLHDKNSNDYTFGAFIIQSTFFFTNWHDDNDIVGGKEMAGFQDLNEDEKALAKKLVIVRKTKRKTQTYPHGSWSKPICNPDGVRQVGVHIVHELKDGYKKLHVPSYNALLHHYRKCDRFLGGETLTSRYLVNRRMHKFAPDLTKRLSGKIKLLKNACPSIKF